MINPERIKKILIIRFSSIGDIVLTTPIVRCLKQQLGAEIHYVTKDGMAQLLKHNPYIDKIHTIVENVKEVRDDLEEEDFDIIVDLHKNIRSKRLINFLRKPYYCFNKLNIEKWLLVNLKINRLPKKHIVDRYFEAIAELGVVNDEEGLDYFLSPEEEEFRKYQCSKLGKYTAIVLGANYYTKRIPTDRIRQLVAEDPEAKYVLIGGKDVADEGRELAKIPGVENTCGRLSIGQSAAMIKQSQRVITGDTGMMHIAAAFKKDVISVWGNTVPEFGMYPYFGKYETNSKILEDKSLSCRPCSKLGYNKCPKGHFKCMMPAT